MPQNALPPDWVTTIVAAVSGGATLKIAEMIVATMRAKADSAKTEAEAEKIRAEAHQIAQVADAGDEEAAVRTLTRVLDALNEQLKKSEERENQLGVRISQMNDELRKLRVQNVEQAAELAKLRADVDKRISGAEKDHFAPMKEPRRQ